MCDRLRQRPGPQRGPLTGPNPTDRGKRGSKIHLLVDRQGLPLSVGISAANLHDSQALVPLVRGIPPIRSRRGPGAGSPRSSTETRATTTRTCDAGSPPAVSATGSPAKAPSPPSGWASTAGSWNARCPGCPAADASTAATNASPNTSSPSPPSQRPSYATAESPNGGT